MSLSPFVLIIGLLVVAAALAALAAYLQGLQYRRSHPSIAARRKELDVQVKLGYITDDIYANQTMALDKEEEEARLRRRTK